MRLLITGGAGFIGSSLTRLCLAEGHHVLVFDKLTYAGHRSSLAEIESDPRFTFFQGCVTDPGALALAFAQHDPDAVLHLAAESHVDRSITGAGVFVDTNINGTHQLLEVARAHWSRREGAARDGFRLLHVSTDEVYGSLGPEGAFTEATPYDPRSPYSASKAASDHLARAWGHTYGLPVIVTNCSNNYGPRQLPEKLAPLTILNAREEQPIPVYGDGQNVRDWLYVDDHARALLAALHRGRPQETYNIGARCERPNLEMVTRICDLLDRFEPRRSRRRELIKFVEDRPGHDRRYAIDPAKIETELGWRPEISFEEGLERTVRWYLDNEAWWGPLRRAGHGAARLGLVT